MHMHVDTYVSMGVCVEVVPADNNWLQRPGLPFCVVLCCVVWLREIQLKGMLIG